MEAIEPFKASRDFGGSIKGRLSWMTVWNMHMFKRLNTKSTSFQAGNGHSAFRGDRQASTQRSRSRLQTFYPKPNVQRASEWPVASAA